MQRGRPLEGSGYCQKKKPQTGSQGKEAESVLARKFSSLLLSPSLLTILGAELPRSASQSLVVGVAARASSACAAAAAATSSPALARDRTGRAAPAPGFATTRGAQSARAAPRGADPEARDGRDFLQKWLMYLAEIQWALLDPCQRPTYRDIVQDNYGTLLSLDSGNMNSNPQPGGNEATQAPKPLPERSESSLYFGPGGHQGQPATPALQGYFHKVTCLQPQKSFLGQGCGRGCSRSISIRSFAYFPVASATVNPVSPQQVFFLPTVSDQQAFRVHRPPIFHENLTL
uniref:Uncharacterized protein n=1 Tax=Sphaerodactylus townsendi TaxID=933632 RepID=A0ACB8EV98_9SAUR